MKGDKAVLNYEYSCKTILLVHKIHNRLYKNVNGCLYYVFIERFCKFINNKLGFDDDDFCCDI